MDLQKFLGKHAGELASIATVLGAVVRALPIDNQDRERLGELVADIGQGARNIAASVARDADKVAVAAKAKAKAAAKTTSAGERKVAGTPTRKFPAAFAKLDDAGK